MIIKLLSIATFISVIIAIYFRQIENLKMYAVFKPITTILIVIISIVIYQKNHNLYSAIIIVALVFSLIGDLFLIGENYFLYGLSSFLLAHIAFTIAFTKISGFNWNIIVILILLVVGGTYLNFLRKDLNNYLIPVAVYISVIIIMNWQAIGLVLIDNSFIFIGIAVASLLFSFSDSIIAYNKFVKPFKSAEILILSTYWIAIYIFTIAGLYINKIDMN